MESFRESFRDLLLPAFRGSFTTMFQQINATLEAGLREQREEQIRVCCVYLGVLAVPISYDQQDHGASNQTFGVIIGLLKQLESRLSQQPQGMRGASIVDQKSEIAVLAEQGRFALYF